MRKSITRRQIHSLRARLRANGDTTALGELELLLALDKSGRRASGSLLGALGEILEEKNYRAVAEEIITEAERRYGAIWEEEDVRLLPSALLSLSLAHIAVEGSAEAISAARSMQNSFSAISPYTASQRLSAMHKLLSEISDEYRVSSRETQQMYRTQLVRVARRERISSTEAARRYADSLDTLPEVLLGCAPTLYFAVYAALTILPPRRAAAAASYARLRRRSTAAYTRMGQHRIYYCRSHMRTSSAVPIRGMCKAPHRPYLFALHRIFGASEDR